MIEKDHPVFKNKEEVRNFLLYSDETKLSTFEYHNSLYEVNSDKTIKEFINKTSESDFIDFLSKSVKKLVSKGGFIKFIKKIYW